MLSEQLKALHETLLQEHTHEVFLGREVVPGWGWGIANKDRVLGPRKAGTILSMLQQVMHFSRHICVFYWNSFLFLCNYLCFLLFICLFLFFWMYMQLYFFPTCQVRVSRFYQSCMPPTSAFISSSSTSAASTSSTASSRSQWALPGLNRERKSSVGTAGPQPRALDLSGHCRISTASAKWNTYIHTYMHVCMYVFMYVCMYVYIW